MSAHALRTKKQFALDTAQIGRVAGLVGVWHGMRWTLRQARRAARSVRRHLFGIVVTLVALTLTAGLVIWFLLHGLDFPAIMFGLIGLLSITIGITYHAMGDIRD